MSVGYCGPVCVRVRVRACTWIQVYLAGLILSKRFSKNIRFHLLASSYWTVR
jgi:hypothetical protein